MEWARNVLHRYCQKNNEICPGKLLNPSDCLKQADFELSTFELLNFELFPRLAFIYFPNREQLYNHPEINLTRLPLNSFTNSLTFRKNLSPMKRTFLSFVFLLASFSVFSQNFTWMKGSNTSGLVGTYGTMGIPAPGNNPGGRHGCGTW